MKNNDLKEWSKSYYVYNDEIIALINLWKDAVPKEKPKIQGQILSKMGYIISKRISCYKNTSMYEDLLQEGRMGIMMAMEKFDADRSPNFFHYSTWHVQNKIRIYLQKQRKNKCEILMEETVDYANETDLNNIMEEKETKSVLLSAIEMLPKIDQQILKMRFGLVDDEGATYKQIGDVFSLSKQRIEQIASRAVLRLKKNKQLKDFFNI